MELNSRLKFKIGISRGKVFFSGIQEGETLPYIRPHPNFIIKVNGQEISEKTPVHQDDQVEIEPMSEIISPGKFEVSLSKDRLSAYIVVDPALKKSYFPADQEPREELDLHSREQVDTIKDVTREAVQQELDKRKISHGILEEALLGALDNPTGTKIMIAQGERPVPGKDASIQLLFKKESQSAPGIDAEGKVDYREILQIPYVDTGETLARKAPPVEGTPGMTVTGDELNPKAPRDISLKATKTTRLSTSGLEVIALLSGFPEVELKGSSYSFKVSNIFSHRGDVDLASGNLRFQGNLEVNGNITEGMSVQAGGNVCISGDVMGASVQAAGNIEINKNVINSTIRAGGIASLLKKIVPTAKSLTQGIQGLQETLGTLKQHPKFKDARLTGSNLQKLTSTLVKTRFPAITQDVEDYQGLLKEVKKDTMSFKVARELLETLGKVEIELGRLAVPKINGEHVNMEKVLMLLEYVKEEIERMPVPESHITVGYALNSNLDASGDIKIFSRGCFQSQVLALGSIEVTSIVRGGTLKAAKDIMVREVGSSSGVVTYLQVPSGRQVQLGKAHENTTLVIGKQVYRFTHLKTNIDAHVSKGKIELQKI